MCSKSCLPWIAAAAVSQSLSKGGRLFEGGRFYHTSSFDYVSELGLRFHTRFWKRTNRCYTTNLPQTICMSRDEYTYTVEPRLSGPRLSGTSIIRLGSFLVIRSENGRVPQTRMRVAAVTMETCLLIFCACADNHAALLFINKVGGSRRGLSIRLSGIFTYPACFWNQGVRIIEVLLYIVNPVTLGTMQLGCSSGNSRGLKTTVLPRI